MAVAPANLVTDPRGLDGLRTRAASDPRGAVREASKAFETLFMQELLKSMRASTMPSGLMEGEGSKLGTEMLDTQLSTQMSGLPGGLSDVIARQLERQMGLAPGPIPAVRSANPTPAPLGARATAIPQVGAAGFVQQHEAGFVVHGHFDSRDVAGLEMVSHRRHRTLVAFQNFDGDGRLVRQERSTPTSWAKSGNRRQRHEGRIKGQNRSIG